MVKEKPSLLRNAQNYLDDLALQNPSLTGIKFDCPLNKIPSYHVTENIIVVIMHDLLEGVCKYSMSALIKNFVRNNVLSLNDINLRIYSFNFIESSNRPPKVQLKDIKRDHISVYFHTFIPFFHPVLSRAAYRLHFLSFPITQVSHTILLFLVLTLLCVINCTISCIFSEKFL